VEPDAGERLRSQLGVKDGREGDQVVFAGWYWKGLNPCESLKRTGRRFRMERELSSLEEDKWSKAKDCLGGVWGDTLQGGG
jgi:hypothetical protein